MSPGPLCNVTGHPTAFEQVAAYTNMGELALLQKLQNLGHPEILLEDVAEFFSSLAVLDGGLMWDMFGEMIPNQHGGVNLGAIHRYACRALADYGEPNMTALCSAIHTSLGGDGSPCEMEACLVNDTELWEALQDPGFSEDYDEKVLQFDKSKISRQFFKDTVRRQAARNDAFFTLPITIIYIICFFLLVIDHLNIFQRHQLETSLEDWTMGRKVARTCKNEVDDLNSWWTWVMGGGNRSRYGLPALLGEDLLVTGPFCRYVLASSNTLIGDVELRMFSTAWPSAASPQDSIWQSSTLDMAHTDLVQGCQMAGCQRRSSRQQKRLMELRRSV